MPKTNGDNIVLACISVRGVVQGVGFRPFVYGLAVKHNLKGWVCNTSEDVKIEVEGKSRSVGEFQLELRTKAPPLARIESIDVVYRPPVGYKTFEIRHSEVLKEGYQLISPDIATCTACLSELFNPRDRRYRYPFTNCTNCGPRFTIIEGMPYDRVNTTMRHFQMCSECQAEYDNPLDRRFHAQPNACPKCGPQLILLDSQGNQLGESDPVAAASRLLKEGKIVAVKGLGGFLLACDATSDLVVKILRQRKRRPSKPFAIMVADLDEARRHCSVSKEEQEVLTSPQSPIVLMKWSGQSSISKEVAPNLCYLGVMLPYTPLHHLLLRDTGRPLVMTSGNLSEEPIAKDNHEALKRLHGIADYFLVHNRDIYSRYDDSVVMVNRGETQLIRRARGYAPYPLHLPFRVRQVLGCGAQEKNTFCLTKDNYAFLSQHIGDMENMETLEHFHDTISLYKRLFHVEPEIVAHDLHPEYLSTKYAQELGESGLKVVPVQHHHAHIISCMVDNRLETPVIGVAFDGTGMGTDGNLWGGEFLVVDYASFRRMGQLEYLPLPGGAIAIKRPYRIAISYILSLLGESALNHVFSRFGFVREKEGGKRTRRPPGTLFSETEAEIIKQQVRKKINSPLTSSMGRLFDAVSALLGIRWEIDYEGQAAVELEMAAYQEDYGNVYQRYPFSISKEGGTKVVRLQDILSGIIADLEHDVPAAIISVKFHNTVALIINEMCQLIANEMGINKIALSGGVFQNRLLLKRAVEILERNGLQVFTHRQVPCNDGGIALGQAVIANFIANG